MFHVRGERSQRGLWLVALALPVALFAGVSTWARRRDRLAADPRLVRFRLAGRDAQRALTAARAQPGRERVDAISAALATYLAAKLDLPPGAVERDRVLQRLAAGGVADGVQSEVTRFFALAEEARYASGGASGVGDAVGDAAERIVAALERERGLERRSAILAVLLSATLLATAGRADEPVQAAFFQGNQAYAAGRYDDAIAAYEQARAGGQESGALAFNLGNAYLKRATSAARSPATSGRRACSRAIRTSSRTWRSRASANIEAPGGPSGSGSRLRSRSAPARASWRPCSRSWVALLGPPVARRCRRGRQSLESRRHCGRRNRGHLGVSLAVRVTAVETAGAAVVVAPGDTPVRFEPTASGTEHFVVTPGVDVSVLEERDGWLLVARADGRRGWLQAESLERVD